MSVRPAPPPPRAPRFLTEDERQWLAQLRQLTCPGTKYWMDHLFGIRDAYGNYPDDYWPYVSYLNTWYEGTFPCNKAESGMTPKGSDGGATPREPVRAGTGPRMPSAFPDYPSPRSTIPPKSSTYADGGGARLRGVLLAGQAQQRKAAATGAPFAAEAAGVKDGAPLQQSVHFYVEVPGEENLKKAMMMVVLLKKKQTGSGKMDFELEIDANSKYAMKINLVDLLTVPVYRNPRGKPTPHTLVYTGDRKMASPPSEAIVAMRYGKEERWRFDDMVETIQKHLTAFAKGDKNTFKSFNVYIQCPCIYK